eukprot:scaffold21796_cov24-Tisochrysis_lutea.AAC.1
MEGVAPRRPQDGALRRASQALFASSSLAAGGGEATLEVSSRGKARLAGKLSTQSFCATPPSFPSPVD